MGLTRALARELGTYGVRVNAIAPGYTDTEGDHHARAVGGKRRRERPPEAARRAGDDRTHAHRAAGCARPRSAASAAKQLQLDPRPLPDPERRFAEQLSTLSSTIRWPRSSGTGRKRPTREAIVERVE